MKVKHSKYKNTGILFELLTRQLTSDTIAGTQPKALSFLKKHFNKEDVVVVLLHDSGSRYIGKIYNDDWMEEKGFI